MIRHYQIADPASVNEVLRKARFLNGMGAQVLSIEHKQITLIDTLVEQGMYSVRHVPGYEVVIDTEGRPGVIPEIREML